MSPESSFVSAALPDGGTLWKLSQEAGPFLKIAGLMGSSAILFATYGQHGSFPKERESDLKKIYGISNHYHYLTTLAMVAVPFARNPPLTGSLILSGATLFCGPFYYYGVTGKNQFKYIAPIGGILILIGFLTMAM